MSNLYLSANIIDVRYIIERIETLESEIETYDNPTVDLEAHDAHMQDKEELNKLLAIMKELESVGGGDEKWRDDWYPLTLIRDSYFTDYARELLEDCGELPRNIPSYIEINWNETAENIRVDYESVTIDGATYWTR